MFALLLHEIVPYDFLCKNYPKGVPFSEVKKLSLSATGRTDRGIPAADHKFNFAYPYFCVVSHNTRRKFGATDIGHHLF